MLKGFAVFALLLFGGGYLLGAFGPQSYSRVVSRSPAEVMASLKQLDITAQPGAPGSTAEAAGGVKPLFRLAQAGDRMTWYVMSGDKVATSMTAAFVPVDGGKATKITTSVERGNAPDDFVSPAFRSKGLTMALFGMAIESQMNKLTMPVAASAETCRELFERMAAQNMPPPTPGERGSFGQGLHQIMALTAMEPEMRRHGCNTNNDGSFRSVEQRMTDGDQHAAASAGMSDEPPVTHPASGDAVVAGTMVRGRPVRPDQPMLDLKPNR